MSLHLFFGRSRGLIYAEWIWLRVVHIYFKEGGIESSSYFSKALLVLTPTLLNF